MLHSHPSRVIPVVPSASPADPSAISFMGCRFDSYKMCAQLNTKYELLSAYGDEVHESSVVVLVVCRKLFELRCIEAFNVVRLVCDDASLKLENEYFS